MFSNRRRECERPAEQTHNLFEVASMKNKQVICGSDNGKKAAHYVPRFLSIYCAAHLH